MIAIAALAHSAPFAYFAMGFSHAGGDLGGSSAPNSLRDDDAHFGAETLPGRGGDRETMGAFPCFPFCAFLI